MIYLDHNATTPLVSAAREAVLAALDIVGNPSSAHAAGRRARALVEEARERVAAASGARPDEIVFTSGGTESCQLGVRGALDAMPGAALTTAIEHRAVLAALEGREAVLAPLDGLGRIDVEGFERALERSGPALVAIASANNEVGTRQPIAALADLARARGALVFCDAVQSLGKEPLDLSALGVDLAALSAHKIGGPKGVGALFVRRGTPLRPLLTGGPQERERRAGTENVPGIAGFGAAAAAVCGRLAAMPAVRARRDALLEGLRARCPGLRVHGDPDGGLPNTLSVSFPGCEGDALRVRLDLAGVMASGGSACASGAIEPSHVLLALGCPEALARSAVRLTLGPETTDDDVALAIERIAAVVRTR